MTAVPLPPVPDQDTDREYDYRQELLAMGIDPDDLDGEQQKNIADGDWK